MLDLGKADTAEDSIVSIKMTKVVISFVIYSNNERNEILGILPP